MTGPGKTEAVIGDDCRSVIDNPSLYFNRELSWIEFNRRVLDEAADASHPLLERVKFLSIFSTNLDEFFMIRVSGLQRQSRGGAREAPLDGMSPARQLGEIRKALEPLLAARSVLWQDVMVRELSREGISVVPFRELPEESVVLFREFFKKEIFPVLIPLASDTAHPFPFISNLSLNLAVHLRDPVSAKEIFARVKVPTNLFPRFLPVPGSGGEPRPGQSFVFLEEIISANLDLLFPGFHVVGAFPFRVTRDADVEIEEDEASDLLTAVEEGVGQRRIGPPVRVEVDPGMPPATSAMLSGKLGIPVDSFYQVRSPLGMSDLSFFGSLDRPDLKDPPFIPALPGSFTHGDGIFDIIRRNDAILFHPYESFSPVIGFLREAAKDPDVLAIKITLYRVGKNSPIVDALLEARENGKAVAALIELKARFDEENNIGWARALERAGVHVVYGLPGLKVHAKICMVVRREKDGNRTYVHLSTGNYNAVTSRVYTDIGFFTADPEIGADAADLFNYLTGCARIEGYRKLLVAPSGIRKGILRRIDREIERHRAFGDGCIIFKMNALVDKDCILALYRASCEGVRVHLQVRGICCLRPGLPGVSDRVNVTSIVGRFLEHARIYYFRNGGMDEVLMGSADLMPRNLDRRVETLYPVEDPFLKGWIGNTVLPVHLGDNVKARVLLPDGTCRRIDRAGREACNAQEWFLTHRGERRETG